MPYQEEEEEGLEELGGEVDRFIRKFKINFLSSNPLHLQYPSLKGDERPNVTAELDWSCAFTSGDILAFQPNYVNFLP